MPPKKSKKAATEAAAAAAANDDSKKVEETVAAAKAVDAEPAAAAAVEEEPKMAGKKRGRCASTTPTKKTPGKKKAEAKEEEPAANEAVAASATDDTPAKKGKSKEKTPKKTPTPSKPKKEKKEDPKQVDNAEEDDVEPSPQYWKEVFLCGTEWDSLAELHKVDWDFSNLDNELISGEFANLADNEKLYLFGGSEPQMIQQGDKNHVVPIPVIVVIRTTVDVPDKLGLNSVQMEKEAIEPMSKFKMGWCAIDIQHKTEEKNADEGGKKRRRGGEHRKNIFVLKCSQRQTALSQLSETRVHRFDYCMPYIFFPHKALEEPMDTSVDIICHVPGRTNPVVFEFDWSMDDVDDMTEEKMEDEELPKDFAATLKKTIEETVATVKTQRKEERAQRKKEIEAMPEEVRNGLKALQKHKFYPCNKNPDVSGFKSAFINRYYGQANKVW